MGTIKYKLFKKPGNLEEFVAKLKGNEAKEVDIHGEEGHVLFPPGLGLGPPMYLVARDVSGKTSYKEKICVTNFSMNVYADSESFKNANEKMIAEAKRWKTCLENQGITANILFKDKDGKFSILTDGIERTQKVFLT